jgi:lactoylglutathione lyase
MGSRHVNDKPSPVKNLTFRIRHTMLPVHDLERSIDFYTRLLGMTVIRRRSNDKAAVGYVGYGPDEAAVNLELIQDLTGGAGKITCGDGHVAVGVNDLTELCAILEKEGVRFKRKIYPNRPGSRDLTAFIHDPDGHEIELTERH